jgi:hypothetical protein
VKGVLNLKISHKSSGDNKVHYLEVDDDFECFEIVALLEEQEYLIEGTDKLRTVRVITGKITVNGDELVPNKNTHSMSRARKISPNEEIHIVAYEVSICMIK